MIEISNINIIMFEILGNFIISYNKRLKNLEAIIADKMETKVVFEIPDEVERKGYSTATKARLDAGKLMGLGWNPLYDIETGIGNCQF